MSPDDSDEPTSAVDQSVDQPQPVDAPESVNDGVDRSQVDPVDPPETDLVDDADQRVDSPEIAVVDPPETDVVDPPETDLVDDADQRVDPPETNLVDSPETDVVDDAETDRAAQRDIARVVWPRRRPKRAAARLGWTALLALLICGPAWLIFSDEPATAAGGSINPLALVAPVLIVLFASLVAPQLLGLIRQPTVMANHYALMVRPGVVRTLVLPWAQLDEIATLGVGDDTFLLVRCRPISVRSADWPRWWDQGPLRSARRGTSAATSYDVAVPMGDFVGTPRELLSELAQRAPDHVAVINRVVT